MSYFKILHLTDIHSRKGISEQIYQKIIKEKHIDLIVISGDITQFGKKKDVRKVLGQFDSLNTPVFYVVGNCDPRDSYDIEFENVKSLEGKMAEFKEVEFIGLSGSNKTPFRTPFELSEEEITKKLELLKKALSKKKPVVLVSHVPPLDSEADIISGGKHVGSQAVKDFLLNEKIAAILTGHIHESKTVSMFNETLCVNPGPARHAQGAIIEVQLYDNGTSFFKGELISLE